MVLIYLEWTISGKNTNKSVELDKQLTIGRKSDNSFVVDDRQVSGQQATLNAVGNKVIIKNVSKNNNIKVGNQIVNKNGGSATLTDKISIEMGMTKLFTRIVEVQEGVTNYVKCTTCSRPIPPDTDPCPWCKSPQTGTNAAYTMA